MAQQPKKVGEFVPDRSWEYDKTGQRQDNYLETESGLGCPVACQSDRIYCNETVWKDRNNNSCLRRRCAGQTERRKRGGARWTQQNSQMTQTAGQTTVHKVADKTHKVTKINQPDTRKTLTSICLSSEQYLKIHIVVLLFWFAEGCLQCKGWQIPCRHHTGLPPLAVGAVITVFTQERTPQSLNQCEEDNQSQ